MKILIAGFHHETNTFAPSKATYRHFVHGEGWPPMTRGVDILNMRNINVPVAGFIAAMEAAAHELVPVIWTAASPSGPVTEDAFERIAGEIVEAVRHHQPDAIFLDLHGAMVAEHVDDGEGELLERLREIVGTSVTIVASLDLHANVTARMLKCADGLVAYRTYPHVDMAETGLRAAQLLRYATTTDQPLNCVSRRLPFLIPINGMCTALEPARSLYRRLDTLEVGGVISLSFAPGFPAADFPECGPVIWGYGVDKSAVERAVNDLAEQVIENEGDWAVTFFSPDEAVSKAIDIARHASRPVVIADTQDNPGAGGNSDTTGMLEALIRNGARKAAIGLLWDPKVANEAHAAGVGATIAVTLGAQSEAPFAAKFVVESLSDGRCIFDGPMMNGLKPDLGLTACLRIDDVQVVVSSTRMQMIDRNLYRMVGIQPELMKILVNKSSVHFRADFEPIAEAVLVARAPGAMLADPGDIPWTRLMDGIRVRPGGKPFVRE